jgi:hypothetical protein
MDFRKPIVILLNQDRPVTTKIAAGEQANQKKRRAG